MVKYFLRYLITTAKHTVKTEPIKYLGKYMPVCPILIAFYSLHIKYFSEKIIH